MARHNGTAAESNDDQQCDQCGGGENDRIMGETPKTRLFTHREAPQLPANPMTNPIAPSLAACLPVRRKMAKVPAPIAMRMRDLLLSAADPVVQNPIAANGRQDHRNPREQGQ